jgi:hypothetical protein
MVEISLWTSSNFWTLGRHLTFPFSALKRALTHTHTHILYLQFSPVPSDACFCLKLHTEGFGQFSIFARLLHPIILLHITTIVTYKYSCFSVRTKFDGLLESIKNWRQFWNSCNLIYWYDLFPWRERPSIHSILTGLLIKWLRSHVAVLWLQLWLAC